MPAVSFDGRNPVSLRLTVVLVLILLQTAVIVCDFPATLTLERAFPANHIIELSQLRDRDNRRHRRILQQSSGGGGAFEFQVDGTYDPYRVGLYYTKVQLGSPPKEYNVQIDTGSDILWVSCNSCNNCPTSSGLKIPIEFYDPSSSSTSSLVTCSDQRCSQANQSSYSGCSRTKDQCIYTFQYGDGPDGFGTSGYYVSDLMHLDTIGVDDTTSSNSSANVVFGCSTSRTGQLTKTERAVDGVFGFGQNGLSIISQLSSQGIAPVSFSHCLIGDGSGGGILVIGQVVEPNIVYTPLVQSQQSYTVNLHSISVNGQTLPIDPSTFATSDQDGTIIDSGTTLAILPEKAYSPFVDAITQSVSQQPFISEENQCYLITSSVSDVFPTVSLNFAGGALMQLRPQDYLVQQNSVNGSQVWCIGFQISIQGGTVLGDLVLKDKLIVYDLGRQRIGWSDYDCSSYVNVSMTSSGGNSEVVNAGQIGGGTSLQSTNYELIPVLILASIIHLAMTIGVFSLW